MAPVTRQIANLAQDAEGKEKVGKRRYQTQLLFLAGMFERVTNGNGSGFPINNCLRTNEQSGEGCASEKVMLP